MKKYFTVIVIAGAIISGSCSYYRSCPAYAVEMENKTPSLSADVKQDLKKIE
jgi:hypothetical protein